MLLKSCVIMTISTTNMRTEFKHTFSAENYIECVAYSKADSAYRRSGQKRADFVYNFYMRKGFKLWSDLCAEMPWYEAEKWLRLWFGNEDTFSRPNSCHKRVANMDSYIGPKAYAKSLEDKIESIKNHVLKAPGKGTETNRKSELKKAVDEAELFLSVSPTIYSAKRHGEWLSETDFCSMMQFCKETVARYAAK